MRNLLALLFLALFAHVAFAVPLSTFKSYSKTDEISPGEATHAAIMCRGTGTSAYYMAECDPSTGAIVTTGTTTSSTTATGSNQLAGSATCSGLTGSYATVITPTFATKILYVFNSCDTTIVISIDGGTTAAFILETGESFTVDLGANGRNIASGVALRAKHNGVVPTAGTVRLSAIGG